ncbi:hypothetical protein DPMN_189320 [Dreissena polymorpha]|uniref:Uncharacterized protein n=1 Tax=Dreissena polymorpha TaxID=45954 RepID=A0A9D4DVC0_DREPO|nr:hypothetical protein DPMN_189320 [Dreissena polymorpha]
MPSMARMLGELVSGTASIPAGLAGIRIGPRLGSLRHGHETGDQLQHIMHTTPRFISPVAHESTGGTTGACL